MRALFVVGRLLFGGFFLVNGINHFLQLSFMAGYAGMKGVPMPEVAVATTGLMLAIGGLTVLLGLWPRVGVGLLVAFLVPTTFIMHDFWSVADPVQRMGEQVNFMKNLALAGAALMLLAIPLPWAASVSSRR